MCLIIISTIKTLVEYKSKMFNNCFPIRFTRVKSTIGNRNLVKKSWLLMSKNRIFYSNVMF